MLLGLSKIIDCPGQSVSFSTEVDLRDLRLGTCEPIKDPVLASGTVRNTAGVLMMKGMIQTRLYGVCDRCACDFERDIEIPIDVILVTELANEDNEDEWVFPLEGDSADLDDIVRTVFVLNLDSKLLCEPDCKGLCHHCGVDRNKTECDCDSEYIDPRLSILNDLFK